MSSAATPVQPGRKPHESPAAAPAAVAAAPLVPADVLGAPAGLPLFLRRAVAGPPPESGDPVRHRPPARVEVGAPDEPLEREADQAAARVLAAPPPRPAFRAADDGPRATAGSGGAGEPIADPVRGRMEAGFRRDFGAVRVHHGTEAAASAHALHAHAYTVGPHIVFGAGRYEPESAAGARLLAHELAHVVQQADAGTAAGALVQRQAADPDRAGGEFEPDTSGDADSPLATATHPAFTIGMVPDEPELFAVPRDATLADVAARLRDDEAAVDGIDFVQVPGVPAVDGTPGRAARIRDTARLTPAAQSALRTALDDALRTDVRWVTSMLSQRLIGDADEWALTEHTLRWSQRSEIRDAAGTQYFDRFLNELNSVSLTQGGLFSDTTRTALDWLLIEAEEKNEQIRKAIELRSTRWTAHYAVTDAAPELVRGDVIGRFYWGTGPGAGSGMQVLIGEAIVHEPTMERAEIATRNASYTGMRVIVPRPDGGGVVGYSAYFPNFDLLLPDPETDPSGRFFWYRPGTILVRSGEFRADFAPGGAPELGQRQQILSDALARAPGDLSDLYGLDFDVLSIATIEQRLQIMNAVLRGAQTPARATDMVARLLLATPNDQFRALEREMSTNGTLDRLFALDIGSGQLAVIGRVFTARSLAVNPVGADALRGMQTFQFGLDDADVFHYAWSESARITSSVVPPADFPARAGPRPGDEPGLAGEAGGPLQRSGIYFYIASWEGMVPSPNTTRVGPFLPTQLVRIEVLGQHPQTVFITALEAAGAITLPPSEIMRRGMRLIEINLWAQAGLGLARAFGPALAEGLMAGGWRAGARAVVAEAGTQAGRQALRAFFGEVLLLGSMHVVDAYREELNQTEAGRAFLAVYDVAMAALAARAVYRVLNSGLIEAAAARGVAAWQALSGAARSGIRNVVQDLEALNLAWRRLGEAERTVTTTPEGFRVPAPVDETRFSVLFMTARAEVAARGLMTALREAGASTTVAERVLARLESLAGSSDEIMRARTAIARRAADMAPAAIDGYLAKVEQVLGVRPGADTRLGGFLRASARAADPAAYLEEVLLLARREGVTLESLEALGNKAGASRRGLDIAWLRTTGLNDAELNFLASDPKTPWNLFQRAAASPGNNALQVMARARLRGIVGEMVTEERAAELFPGYRITGRQVPIGSNVLDFVLTSTDGRGARNALEVKAWTPDNWRDALNTWRLRGTAGLTEQQTRLIAQLEGLIDQLRSARTPPYGPPFLAISDGLTGPTRAKLDAFLMANAPGTQVVTLGEQQILDTAARMRQSLGMPEQLAPTTGAGGAVTPVP